MLSNTQKERDDLLQALAAQRALTLKREQELAAVRFENRALRHEQKSFASSFPGTAQLLGAPVELRSIFGRGTHVSITLPLAD